MHTDLRGQNSSDIWLVFAVYGNVPLILVPGAAGSGGQSAALTRTGPAHAQRRPLRIDWDWAIEFLHLLPSSVLLRSCRYITADMKRCLYL